LTHGCRLNQFETDAVAAQFGAAGHETVSDVESADLVILNTCTVTQAADREGRRLARSLAGRLGAERVVVTGCSVQRDGAPYAALGLRLVAGNSHKGNLLDLLESSSSSVAVTHPDPVARVNGLRVSGLSSHARAYLRVQDGCNQTCTFCTLPSVRGTSASAALSVVCEEARALGERGHEEIVLTGAHLGSHGYDLVPRVALPELIEAVLEAAPRARVRLSSLEPRFVSSGLLGLLRSEPRLCPHLHLPLQSGDDGVLARMRRAYRSGPYEARALAACDAAPGMALGADFIVGFPGEDDTAFARTMEMVERLPYTYGHVFSYSDRPGTPAASLEGHVAPDVIRRRSAVLRAALARKHAAFLRSQVGREVEVVVESCEPGWIARGTTEHFLPARVTGPGIAPRTGSRLRGRVIAIDGDALVSTTAPAGSSRLS
jgi:threonylcarbamoyladenosine tRNA methylthiotransferase MtaB